VAIDTPDGLSTLLSVFNALRDGERERIREDPKCGLEAHPVLAYVGDRLGWIPFESDLHAVMSLHKCSNEDIGLELSSPIKN